MHVMAGILRDAQGRVLLAQRPEGKHLAGSWEFPGGKREPGERPQDALARELREELGIHIDPVDGMPLIRVPWRYGERDLLLDAWQFTRWVGIPDSLEGQALHWTLPSAARLAGLAPADRPILQAIRLPPLYAITPADAIAGQIELWQARVEAALARGVRLIQLRFPRWPIEQVRKLAARLQPRAMACDACLLLNGDIDGARLLGPGVGAHLTSSQLLTLTHRPLPWTQLIGASCHDEAQLTESARIADFATLSPVAPTGSHPDAVTLGWSSFAAMAETAALPVYALGGMTPGHVDEARRHGGQGVAGISAFW
ncbi:Nudix family hydrolase [Dyella jejuensis]|uniref:8-oxo-dGTP diphosphatase n=2 Tax=Dyella jejuensis TaxID=1432009 RepID=A0ABW8JN27_9GAMM